MQIPRRALVTMMNALSSGVVPRKGLEFIAVGRRKESETFVNDLDDTAEGGGAFRIISGRYGSGKSFMIQMIRNYAMDNGFVVMDADLSVDRRFTGGKREGLNTYRELIKNMAIRSRPDGGAMESVIQSWYGRIAQSLSGDLGCQLDEVPEKELTSALRSSFSSMNNLQYSHDFSSAMMSYREAQSAGSDNMESLKWLKGEFENKTESRSAIGIGTIISDGNWYDFIKLWAEFSVKAGFKGLVVFFDEGSVLCKIQNRASRNNNYERFLTMFNDIMQGKASHLSMYLCGTPELIEDEDRGLYSYGALKSRFVEGRFENGLDNYMGPVIRLHPLSNEEIFVLFRTLRDMHESRYEYESNIDDDMIATYLKTVMATMGASIMTTPRELTRDFISLLDTLKQNPDKGFDDLVKGRKVDVRYESEDDLLNDLEI